MAETYQSITSEFETEFYISKKFKAFPYVNDNEDILEDLKKIVNDDKLAAQLKQEMKNEVRCIKETGEPDEILLVRYADSSKEWRELYHEPGYEKVLKSFFYIVRTDLSEKKLTNDMKLLDDRDRSKKREITFRSMCFKSLAIPNVNFYKEAYIQMDRDTIKESRKSVGKSLPTENMPNMYKDGILYQIKPFPGISMVRWSQQMAQRKQLNSENITSFVGQLLLLVEKFRENQMLHRRLNPDSIKVCESNGSVKIVLNELGKLKGSSMDFRKIDQTVQARRTARLENDHDWLFRSPELLIQELRRAIHDENSDAAEAWLHIADPIYDDDKKAKEMKVGLETDYFNIGLIIFNFFRNQFAKPLDTKPAINRHTNRFDRGQLYDVLYSTNQFVTSPKDMQKNKDGFKASWLNQDWSSLEQYAFLIFSLTVGDRNYEENTKLQNLFSDRLEKLEKNGLPKHKDMRRYFNLREDIVKGWNDCLKNDLARFDKANCFDQAGLDKNKVLAQLDKWSSKILPGRPQKASDPLFRYMAHGLIEMLYFKKIKDPSRFIDHEKKFSATAMTLFSFGRLCLSFFPYQRKPVSILTRGFHQLIQPGLDSDVALKRFEQVLGKNSSNDYNVNSARGYQRNSLDKFVDFDEPSAKDSNKQTLEDLEAEEIDNFIRGYYETKERNRLLDFNLKHIYVILFRDIKQQNGIHFFDCYSATAFNMVQPNLGQHQHQDVSKIAFENLKIFLRNICNYSPSYAGFNRHNNSDHFNYIENSKDKLRRYFNPSNFAALKKEQDALNNLLEKMSTNFWNEKFLEDSAIEKIKKHMEEINNKRANLSGDLYKIFLGSNKGSNRFKELERLRDRVRRCTGRDSARHGEKDESYMQFGICL